MEISKKMEISELLFLANDEMATTIDNVSESFVNSDKENASPNTDTTGNETRRHDEPAELSFEVFPENKEEKAKRRQIELALEDPETSIQKWREFAKSEYGLVNGELSHYDIEYLTNFYKLPDDLRKRCWPLLLGVDREQCDPVPTLEELSTHPEYNQVVLDVNRSLKRFPPGIPIKQRLALQDQLTVIILRVINKYPHLSYYQGYHDIAVTFLLVAGEEIAFHIMEILSTDHLVECMQKTFEIVQKRLLIIYALVWREKQRLFEYLERSQCGLLFALPWYLTWFGHSLNQYRSVVRLYDYFLASDPLMPLYVTAAIVLYREEDIFREECDRAMLHCCLSQLPDDLPFEYLLLQSEKLFKTYPPHDLHKDIEKIIEREQKMRDEEDLAFETRRQMLQRRRNPPPAASPFISRFFPAQTLFLSRRSLLVTTAFSIVIGFFAYYYKTRNSFHVDVR